MKEFIIVIGRSGAGKSTQIQLLKSYYSSYNFLSISTGERFRSLAKEDNYTAELIREYNLKGELLPYSLAVWNWSSLFIENINESTNLILDGAPRQLIEAEALDSAIKFYKYLKPKVMYFNLARQEAINRLTNREEGRADDSNFDAILRRQDWFDEKVLLVVDFYKKNNFYTFIEIDASKSIEEIFEKIKNKCQLQ